MAMTVPPIRRKYFGYVDPEPIPTSYPCECHDSNSQAARPAHRHRGGGLQSRCSGWDWYSLPLCTPGYHSWRIATRAASHPFIARSLARSHQCQTALASLQPDTRTHRRVACMRCILTPLCSLCPFCAVCLTCYTRSSLYLDSTSRDLSWFSVNLNVHTTPSP